MKYPTSRTVEDIGDARKFAGIQSIAPKTVEGQALDYERSMISPDAVMAPRPRLRDLGRRLVPGVMGRMGFRWRPAPSIGDGEQAMQHYVGIDVSLELSSVCIVDANGKIALRSES